MEPPTGQPLSITPAVAAPEVPEGVAPAVPPQGAAPAVPPQGAAPAVPPQGAAPAVPPQGAAPAVPPQEGAAPAVPVQEGAAPAVPVQEEGAAGAAPAVPPQEGAPPPEGAAPAVPVQEEGAAGAAPAVPPQEGAAPHEGAAPAAPVHEEPAVGAAPQGGVQEQVPAPGGATPPEGAAPAVPAEQEPAVHEPQGAVQSGVVVPFSSRPGSEEVGEVERADDTTQLQAHVQQAFQSNQVATMQVVKSDIVPELGLPDDSSEDDRLVKASLLCLPPQQLQQALVHADEAPAGFMDTYDTSEVFVWAMFGFYPLATSYYKDGLRNRENLAESCARFLS